MAVVPVRVNGREYQVACDDGQEEQLQFLAREVDERAKSLLRGMRSNPGEIMVMLLTSLMMADELVEGKKDIEYLSAEAHRLSAMLNEAPSNEERPQAQEERRSDIEQAVATTIEEIAARIERIADRIEVR